MHPFRYVRASTPREAVALAADDRSARFVAGGTNLIDLMRAGAETPGLLIDINHLGLNQVEVRPDGLRIGALARDIACAAGVRAGYPVLAEALLAGASPQIRNTFSPAGNLLQRTRCAYFRDPSWACNKRVPGSGCAALHGLDRGHAIFGASSACSATHPSDLAVALIVLDAVVHTLGPAGSRTIPLEALHLLPGSTPERETVLEPGELIVRIDVPNSPRAARSHYLKVRERTSYAFALASAAVAIELEGAVVVSARIGLGGVATRPWRGRAAEDALVHHALDEDVIQSAAAAAVSDAVPLRQNGFKIELVRRTLARALRTVRDGAFR
jgi:xanthine dehydrogenase YagS FAD-binding subunit